MKNWLILAIFSLIGVPFTASAAGFTVDPAFQELVLEPGAAETAGEITLTNSGNREENFRLSAIDFGTLDESGGVAFLGESGEEIRKYALAPWMNLEKDRITIAPGASERIRITIRNDGRLAPGGHYGAVVFEAENTPLGDSEGSRVAIEHRFASLFFLNKRGGEIYHLNLQRLEKDSSFFLLTEAVRYAFANQGNVHTIPHGVITLKDPLGRIVRKGIINEESAPILPESERAFKSSLHPVALAWLPGQYTLEVQYRHTGKTDFSLAEQRFSSFHDWRLLTAEIGALMLLLIFVFVYRKYYRKKASIKP